LHAVFNNLPKTLHFGPFKLGNGMLGESFLWSRVFIDTCEQCERENGDIMFGPIMKIVKVAHTHTRAYTREIKSTAQLQVRPGEISNCTKYDSYFWPDKSIGQRAAESSDSITRCWKFELLGTLSGKSATSVHIFIRCEMYSHSNKIADLER
jgi:hypothetical protein